MLSIFIDLFNIIWHCDHSILIRKLKLYGVKVNNITWFESYISNRKQYISYNSNKCSTFESITRRFPQLSILGPSLFLLYVNDFPNASNILDTLMFADNTNLFYSHYDIRKLFSTINEEPEELGDWFTTNILSMNIKKTKYTSFHKSSVKDNLPLKLPDLHISNKSIARKSLIKSLRVMPDKHIAWNDHIYAIDKNLAKNVNLLCRAKQFLKYFSHIHSYLSYANITWASKYFTKLKTIHYQQKHAERIIFNEDILTHSRPVLLSLNALKIYQIIYINMLTLCTNFKKSRRQKYLILFLKSLPINILPSFQNLTLKSDSHVPENFC